MPDIFDQFAAQKGTQTTAQPQPQTTTVQTAAPAQPQQRNDIFDHLASGQYNDQSNDDSQDAGFLHGLYQSTVEPVVDLAKKEYHATVDPILHPIDSYKRHADTQEQAKQQISAGKYSDAAHTLLSSLEQDSPVIGVIHGLINAHLEQGKKTYDSAKSALASFQKGNYAEAQRYLTEAEGHGLATIVPIVGPAAADAGEDIGSGKTGQGLGKATGIIGSILAPEMAAKGLGKVGTAIENTKAVRAAREADVPLSAGQAVKAAVSENPTIQKIMADPAVSQSADLKAAAEKIGQDIGSKIPQNASPTEIGQHIQNAVTNEKAALGKQFDAIDAQISAAGGDSIKLPKERAQALRGFVNDELDTTFVESKRAGFEPNATQQQARQQLLSATDPKKPLTFEEARQLRNQIRSTAQSGELTAQQKGALIKFDGMLGDEMQKALANKPNLKDLATQRQVLNGKYQTFTKSLEDGVLKNFFSNENGKIVLKAGKDPEAVASYLVKNASPTTAAQLRALTGKDFATVQDAMWRDVWKQTLEQNDGLAASKTLKKLWGDMGSDTQSALMGDKPEILARQQKLMQVADALQLGEKNGRLGFMKGSAAVGGAVGGAIGAGIEHLLKIGNIATGGVAYLGYKGLSKLVTTPGGAETLIRALKAPKGKMQAAAMANLINYTASHNIKMLQQDEQ
jgi:hypothetical protein